jgi:signal transduction histidine kinase/DNA-binding response OmpR family regulator
MLLRQHPFFCQPEEWELDPDMPSKLRANILLVDDNPKNLFALEATLESLGENLVKANSGEEALKYLLKQDFAVILLDVQMPGMDGFEIARLIRDRERSRHTPIIFLTGISKSDEHIIKGYSLGAVDYLVKPIVPEILKAKVGVFVELYKKTEEVKLQQIARNEAEVLQQRTLVELHQIADAVALLVSDRPLEKIFKELIRSAATAAGTWMGSISLIDKRGETLSLAVGVELPEDYIEKVRNVPVGKRSSGACSLAATGKEPVIVADTQFDPLFESFRRYIKQETFRAIYSVPIISRDGSILGTFATYFPTPYRPSNEELGRARVFANLAATAIENARLIAERKQAEEALRAAHDDLEKRVEERTYELARTNDELRNEIAERMRIEEERANLLVREQEARKEAEVANRLKDEFLATVSHELRTPLTAMLGWARMLKNKTLDEVATVRAIDTIERNAKTQAQLIEDLLDISRIITGKLNLEIQQIEAVPIIQSAIDTVRPVAEAKSIQLQIALDPWSGKLSGDPIRLQQVVWNLLSNAIKFTPAGGQVAVRLENLGAHLELTVSDSGKGIDPEFLPFVFDRFRQADGSITRAHGGLGLGLAIVRHLVELHGGTVEAASKGEGHGATFTVKLPIKEAVFDFRGREFTPQMAAPVYSKDISALLKGLRILIVDDDNDTREMLSEVLEQSGVEAKTASSAKEALELLGSWNIDLIISDIGMPGEDGYNLICKVRSTEKISHIPAIALTAFARSEDRIKALSVGFQTHVPKPIDPIELVMVVATLTERIGAV